MSTHRAAARMAASSFLITSLALVLLHLLLR